MPHELAHVCATTLSHVNERRRAVAHLQNADARNRFAHEALDELKVEPAVPYDENARLVFPVRRFEPGAHRRRPRLDALVTFSTEFGKVAEIRDPPLQVRRVPTDDFVARQALDATGRDFGKGGIHLRVRRTAFAAHDFGRLERATQGRRVCDVPSKSDREEPAPEARRLLPAELGERRIDPALQSPDCIALAFAVPNEQNVHLEVPVVDIDITYQDDLHCSAVHRPSKTELATDAPVDNQGRGASFSPTDLVATGLGTCMATTMGIVAQRKGYALDGLRVHVKKVMTTTPPRRIARLECELAVPTATAQALNDEARTELEHTAHNCPVRLSLLDAVEVPVRFEWGSQQR